MTKADPTSNLLPTTRIGPWSFANFKHAPHASESSECYEALLLKDGKPFAAVTDTGLGAGPDFANPNNLEPDPDLEAEVTAWGRQHLPPVTLGGTSIAQNASIILGKLAQAQVLLKDLKRGLARKSVVFDPDDPDCVAGKSYAVYAMPPTAAAIQEMLAANPRLKLLNDELNKA